MNDVVWKSRMPKQAAVKNMWKLNWKRSLGSIVSDPAVEGGGN